MQPEERKDGHDDDNQPDQINNIVHTSLPSAPARMGMSESKRQASMIVPFVQLAAVRTKHHPGCEIVVPVYAPVST